MPGTEQKDTAQMSKAELIEALKMAEAGQSAVLTLKVSPKGGVSVYGLGRFPTTLYAQQWERLLVIAPQIAQFLVDNAAALSRK